MKRFSLLFTSFLCLFCATVSGQQFKKGYVVTLEGDTIRGLLSYQSDKANAAECVLRRDEKAAREVLTPRRIKSYRYYEPARYYVSRTLMIGNEKKSVFLECLQEGPVSLFYFTDGGIDRYFLVTKAGAYYEIKREDLVKESGIWTTNQVKDVRYMETLAEIFGDCPKVKDDIRYVTIDHSSLKAITKKYNLNCGGGNGSISFEPQRAPWKFAFSIKGGQSYYLQKLYGELENKNTHVQDTFCLGDMQSPMISVQTEFYMPGMSPNSRITLGASFAKMDYENEKERAYLQNNTTYDIYKEKTYYHAKQLTVDLGFKLFYPGKVVRPYLGAGALYYKLLDPVIGKNKLVYNSVDRKLSADDKMTNSDYDTGYFSHKTSTFGLFISAGTDVYLTKRLALTLGAQGEYIKDGYFLKAAAGIKF